MSALLRISTMSFLACKVPGLSLKFPPTKNWRVGDIFGRSTWKRRVVEFVGVVDGEVMI